MYDRDRDAESAEVETLPLDLGYLPEFFVKKAERELHDTPEKRVQGLRQLREMAKRDKHMKNIEFLDEFLEQYLLVRKHNVARAFSQLKAFVNFKRRFSDIFKGYQFDNIVKCNDFLVLLPKRCPDGCTILLAQLDYWDPEQFPIEDLRRTIVLLLLQSLRDPMTQVNGFKAIIDVKSNPLRHLRYCTPKNLYMLYHGTQECVPGRYKEVHVVNQSITFKAAWLIVKPFLPDKLLKRIHFHSNSDSLLDFFPRSALPEQYGGTLENYDMTDWLRKAMSPENLATMSGETADTES